MSKTVWRKTIELYEQDGVDWGFFEPKVDVNGVECYCVGGALAKVLTGDPMRMYERPGDSDYSPELAEAFERLVEYVRVTSQWDNQPYQLVYKWNDHLPRDTGKEIVLKTLEELDELEGR